MTDLHPGIENAMKCRGPCMYTTPVNIGVRQCFVLAPSFFITCMDEVFGRVVNVIQ